MFLKNKDKRVHKTKKMTLAKLALLTMLPAAVTLFPSCQTSTVYTLNRGTLAIEDFTPAEKTEWRKDVNMSIHKAQDAYSNPEFLKAIDTNLEMPITMRNNNVDMAMNKDFYDKYSADCSWCYRYVKDLFSVIAPDVQINLKVINNVIDENTFFAPHIIAYSEHNYEGESFLGSTNKHLGVSVKDGGNKATITSNVIMNSKYEERFEEQSSYFRKALLHETLHAFGLNHLEEKHGGNIMELNCSDNVNPITLSPTEMEKMISLYSTRSESFLRVFMNWYSRQYDNCMQYVYEHAEEYKNADVATRSQMILDNTINCREFFEVFKQYDDDSTSMSL